MPKTLSRNRRRSARRSNRDSRPTPTPGKERLYQLVDAIPAREVRAAERYLEFLQGGGERSGVAGGATKQGSAASDKLRRLLAEAPVDDEPLTDEDRVAIQEGLDDIAAGRVVPHEVVRREWLGEDSARA